MTPDNLPTNAVALKLKLWLQNAITPEYFRRVAFAMTICLAIYFVYLMVKGGPVNLGILLAFVGTSFVSQAFYGQAKPKEKS